MIDNMDALDALLCFGYEIISFPDSKFGLTGVNADMDCRASILPLLAEMQKSTQYYTDRVNEIGAMSYKT